VGAKHTGPFDTLERIAIQSQSTDTITLHNICLPTFTFLRVELLTNYKTKPASDVKSALEPSGAVGSGSSVIGKASGRNARALIFDCKNPNVDQNVKQHHTKGTALQYAISGSKFLTNAPPELEALAHALIHGSKGLQNSLRHALQSCQLEHNVDGHTIKAFCIIQIYTHETLTRKKGMFDLQCLLPPDFIRAVRTSEAMQIFAQPTVLPNNDFLNPGARPISGRLLA